MRTTREGRRQKREAALDDDITEGIFPGSGPFAIPLLARVESLDNPGHPKFALLRCEFEDGAPVFVLIANQATIHGSSTDRPACAGSAAATRAPWRRHNARDRIRRT